MNCYKHPSEDFNNLYGQWFTCPECGTWFYGSTDKSPESTLSCFSTEPFICLDCLRLLEKQNSQMDYFINYKPDKHDKYKFLWSIYMVDRKIKEDKESYSLLIKEVELFHFANGILGKALKAKNQKLFRWLNKRGNIAWEEYEKFKDYRKDRKRFLRVGYGDSQSIFLE